MWRGKENNFADFGRRRICTDSFVENYAEDRMAIPMREKGRWCGSETLSFTATRLVQYGSIVGGK
jgi:hypothetical protein